MTSRAARMLEVLRDGKPHTRRDLFNRIGFFLCNNGASELRAAGYDVRQSRERVDGVNVYSYQLLGSLEERDPSRVGGALLGGVSPPPKPSRSSSELDSLPQPDLSVPPSGDDGEPLPLEDGRSGCGSEPEPLFTYPRTPAWG
jgi:hypothetical protein